jgi:hypothetical protein
MLHNDLSLNFTCPICAAAPDEKCELNSGTPRFESHTERMDIAKDYLDRQKQSAERRAGRMMRGGPLRKMIGKS